MTDEPDTSILDELDRRERRARITQRQGRKTTHTTIVKSKAVRSHGKAVRRPTYGPPVPETLRRANHQSSAAEARRGLRNAARSEAAKDDECQAVLDVLGTLRGVSFPLLDRAAVALARWAADTRPS